MRLILPLLLALLVVPAVGAASLGAAAEPTPNQTAAPNAMTTTVPETTTATASTTATPTTSPTATPTATATPSSGTPTPVGAANVTGPDTSRDVEIVVDENVAILDTEYNSGTFKLRVYSDAYTTLTLAAAPDGSSEKGTIQFKTEALDANKIVDIYISSESGVTAWTDASAEDGRAVYVRKPSQGIVDGPYDGADVRNGAAGAAIGVAIAVIYEAVAAKIGAADRMERFA